MSRDDLSDYNGTPKDAIVPLLAPPTPPPSPSQPIHPSPNKQGHPEANIA